ncbi:MAG: hypothetical protein ABI954_08930 [Pyrinomonadaceae bacterium]
MYIANKLGKAVLIVLLVMTGILGVAAQSDKDNKKKQQDARPITIPISVRERNSKTARSGGEIVEAGNLIIKENGEPKQILSLRSTANSPLAFAVLIQEDVASEVNLELKGIANFIRQLPRGSRVMVAYLRSGTIDVRQKFTDDLEKAARSLRIISGSSAVAPYNPYVGVIESLDRFDNLPIGRRAILMVSDGLDASRGVDSASPSQSVDLDRAILKAQRSGTAVYSIYAATQTTGNGSSILVSYGQGSLNRLTEETGGRSFFQGTGTPVSFAPYLRELGTILSRQFALTFLSTGSKKDLRRLEVTSDNPDVKIEYPKNYIPR